jgi:hypothetical protein
MHGSSVVTVTVAAVAKTGPEAPKIATARMLTGTVTQANATMHAA